MEELHGSINMDHDFVLNGVKIGYKKKTNVIKNIVTAFTQAKSNSKKLRLSSIQLLRNEQEFQAAFQKLWICTNEGREKIVNMLQGMGPAFTKTQRKRTRLVGDNQQIGKACVQVEYNEFIELLSNWPDGLTIWRQALNARRGNKIKEKNTMLFELADKLSEAEAKIQKLQDENQKLQQTNAEKAKKIEALKREMSVDIYVAGSSEAMEILAGAQFYGTKEVVTIKEEKVRLFKVVNVSVEKVESDRKRITEQGDLVSWRTWNWEHAADMGWIEDSDPYVALTTQKPGPDGSPEFVLDGLWVKPCVPINVPEEALIGTAFYLPATAEHTGPSMKGLKQGVSATVGWNTNRFSVKQQVLHEKQKKVKKYEVLHEKHGEPSILLVSHAFKSGTSNEEQKQTIQAFQDLGSYLTQESYRWLNGLDEEDKIDCALGMAPHCSKPMTRLSIEFESVGHLDQNLERMGFPAHENTPYCNGIEEDERHVMFMPQWQRMMQIGKQDRLVILSSRTLHGSAPLKQWRHQYDSIEMKNIISKLPATEKKKRKGERMKPVGDIRGVVGFVTHAKLHLQGKAMQELVDKVPSLKHQDALAKYAFCRENLNKSHIQNAIQSRIIEQMGDDKRVPRLLQLHKASSFKRKRKPEGGNSSQKKQKVRK